MRRRRSLRITGREPGLGDMLHRRSARLGGDAALLHTLEMLSHENPQVRYRAAFTLAEMDDRRAVDILLDLLLSAENTAQRQRAARALGRLGDASAVQPLALVMLGEEPWPVRGTAAEALGRIAARVDDKWPPVELLAAALGDETHYVRMKAAYALGAIGEQVTGLLLESLVQRGTESSSEAG
ncbi:MAG TPA: HEAT repeat domain-containing protein, partial [Aggregatilineales bacterium]|nr:HEAT repeat domain-containing protein [Aggregatilineales bacterium]